MGTKRKSAAGGRALERLVRRWRSQAACELKWAREYQERGLEGNAHRHAGAYNTRMECLRELLEVMANAAADLRRKENV